MDYEIRKEKIYNGETLAYRYKKGGEKTLLLIHGNMTSSKHWDLLMDVFDNEYTVYAVDMRGFGESTYINTFNSLSELSEDINDLCRILKLRDLVVIGWSTGGGVAMELAAAHPEKVKRLILMESVGTKGYPILRKNEKGQPVSGEYLVTKEEIASDPVKVLPILNAYASENKEMLKAVWNAVIYNNNKPEDDKYDEYCDDMLTQKNLVDIDYSLVHFNISSEFNGIKEGTGAAGRIKCPVLILWGKNDLVVPEYMALDIKKDIGYNAKLIYLENSGHSPIIDNIEQLLEKIYDFI